MVIQGSLIYTWDRFAYMVVRISEPSRSIYSRCLSEPRTRSDGVFVPACC
ncbi:hypothetical protein HanRHA438_Chr17g0830241 [Helianthus annuus]|nr:hypothetical protein HanRHA438_Chr17g0830241 [Helianthus annuus]